MALHSDDCLNPIKMRGENHLGTLLKQVRDELLVPDVAGSPSLPLSPIMNWRHKLRSPTPVLSQSINSVNTEYF